MIFLRVSHRPCHAPQARPLLRDSTRNVKLVQTKPPPLPGGGTTGLTGPSHSKEAGQPSSSLLTLDNRQQLRDGPEAEPALGAWWRRQCFQSRVQGPVTYLARVGPGHGRVRGKRGEEGVAEFRHEHVCVQQCVLLHGDWGLPAIPVLVPIKHVIVLPPTGGRTNQRGKSDSRVASMPHEGNTLHCVTEQQGLPDKR